MEYKCTNCGGELHYSPKLGKLECPFCGQTYDLPNEQGQNVHDQGHDHEHSHDHSHDQSIPYYSDTHSENPGDPGTILDHEVHEQPMGSAPFKPTKSTDGTDGDVEDLVVYSCPHCGAEVVTDKTTTATSCIFCKTPLVIEKQASGSFRPRYIIPFEIDRKRIGELYERYIADKPFVPANYMTENVIAKIRGIYLPYWLYDLHVSGSLQARGEHTTTYTSGKYMVTRHHVYDLYRAGYMDLWKVPVVASSKAQEAAMNAIEPFNYGKLSAYNSGYLPGFVAQRYDQDASQKEKRSSQRAEESFNNAVMSTMAGFEGLKLLGGNMKAKVREAAYAMLPVYLLYMDYDSANGEDGLIAINGQTGKIAGNIPIDKHKKNRFFLTRFLLIFAISFAAFLTGIFLIQ